MDYKKLKITEFKYWTLYLHQNQYYLGRVYIWSKRPGLVDLMDITNVERKELFEIARVVKKVLSNLFEPDLFNWASLGNLSSQCHLHMIPRYKKRIEFCGVNFNDKRWGKNYTPYDYSFSVSDSTLEKIKEAIVFQMKGILAAKTKKAKKRGQFKKRIILEEA